MLILHVWIIELYMTIKATIALDGGVVAMNKQTAVFITFMSKL